jgi:DNA-binding NarL/FixJ family response regulator
MYFGEQKPMKRKQPNKRARILIVDDHPAVRDALAARIGLEPDMEVCGEAADVNEALALVAKAQPDVAVIDISLKTGNGIDLIKRIKHRNDSVRMLVWSMHGESLYAERALRAGALGFINKDQATRKIVEAVRRVSKGKLYLSSMIAEKMLRSSIGGRQDEATGSPVQALADRELEVLSLIGQGTKTAKIAQRLHVSVKTIETYRDRIRQKLSLEDGTELAHYATQWVLENPGENSR